MGDFSTRLRELRAQHRLRQRDLAEKLGLAQTTIANYEQGSRFPDETILCRVADHFGVTLDYLLGRAAVNLAGESFGYARGFYSDQAEKLPPLEPLARGYLDALLAGDREEAVRLVLEAVAQGRPVEELYLEVFERTLKEVGRLWAGNRLDVGTEHFFTASTEAIMGQLRRHLMAGAGERTGLTCLAFSVCGELHDVGARMVADLLERAGWRCLFLGGDLGNQDILAAAEEHRADLLAVSATMYMNVDSVARLIRALQEGARPRNFKILVGGRPFSLDPELWKRVGADGHAWSAVAAVSRAAALMGRGAARAPADMAPAGMAPAGMAPRG